MGSFVVKPVPDRDFYIHYSESVDMWTLAGSREDFLQEGFAEDRLDRADRYGTSSINRWYGYASRTRSPALLFRGVGPEYEDFLVPYASIEALIVEQDALFDLPEDEARAAERGVYEKHGTKWVPED